jgi:nucleoside-diphosphate-sugar epimerase
MKVLITGGNGAVGKAVVERLAAKGWEALVIGRTKGVEIPNATYESCDITNYDDLREKVRGCDTIVHLAAIPNPMKTPGPELFRINVTGTYNIYEAAAAEGITQLVQASSINAFGCFWGNVDIAPRYLPVDEAHPTNTTDPYSFSKTVIESIGDYYWRRNRIASVALRLPGVWPHARLSDPAFHARRQQTVALIDEFARQPADQQAERLAQLRAATAAYRGAFNMEYPNAQNGFPRPDHDDPLFPVYAFERFNFWAYIDERDSAQAIEQGLTVPYQGSHALFVNAADNSLGYESTELARLFFPEVPAAQVKLRGTETLVSIARARDLIGYEPAYSVLA